MDVTRRCFMKFCGGATAGAIISPLPWKLLDDVSIWTQNGSWVAHPPHGPVSYLHTTCTLCPAGCGMRLRRVGEHTVSAWGVPGHPLSDGRLCSVGLGAAQILFHPARIRGAACRGRGKDDAWSLVDTPVAISEVGRKLSKLRAAGAAEQVAILDLRPGRSLSVLYREFLTTAGGGRYLTLPSGREQASAALADLVDLQGNVPGYDFARTAGVISFGAPVFDGWCGAGPAPGLLSRHGEQRPGRTPHVVQVETNGSMNASLADAWLPLRPGTEAALTQGLAHILRHELAANELWGSPRTELENEFWPGYRRSVARHTPERVAEVTGIKPSVLRTTARNLLRNGPVIVVGGGNPGGGPLGRAEELAIWALNLTLGSVGRPGGVVLRRDLPEIFAEPVPTPAESLWEIPDRSLDLLLVDGSMPGATLPRGLLRRKMRSPTSLIVGLSPYAAGATAEADMVIPTAAAGEWLDDVPPQALAARASYAFSPAVEKSPSWSLHPANVLDRFAAAAGFARGCGFGKARHEQILRRRLETLYDRGTGDVFDPRQGTAGNLSNVSSPRRFEKILAAGGCWTEPAVDTVTRPTLRLGEAGQELAVSLAEMDDGRLPTPEVKSAAYPLVVMLAGQPILSQSGILPPVVNKLYRESNLMAGTGMARLNPATVRSRGWKDGRQVILETALGALPVTVVLDETVMPGVVLMSSGPGPASMGDPDDDNNILEICGATQHPVWRVERAKLREV